MTETRNTTSVGFRRLAAASVFASLLVFALSVTIMPAAVNEIVPQLCHNSYVYYGGIYPVWMLGFFVSALIGGRYADKIGKLPMLLAGCTMMALGSFAFGQATTYATVVIAGFVMGAGGGFTEANSMALIADVFGEARRTAMMNFSQVFFAVGAVMGPMAVTSLLVARADWRWAFIGTAALCAVSAVICLAGAARREERPLAHEQIGSWRVLLRDRLVLWLSLGIFLYVGAETGQASALAAYFKHDLRSAGPLAASTVAVFWAGIGLGRMAAAWSSRHLSDYVVICSSLALAVVSQAALLLFSTPGPAIGAALVLGFALAPVWPTIVSRAGAAHPLQSGAVMCIVVSAGSLGAAVVPPAIGQTAARLGMRSALWICFLLLAANLVLFLRLWQRNRVQSEAP